MECNRPLEAFLAILLVSSQTTTWLDSRPEDKYVCFAHPSLGQSSLVEDSSETILANFAFNLMDPNPDDQEDSRLSVSERLKAIEEANKKAKEEEYMHLPSNHVVRRKIKAKWVEVVTYFLLKSSHLCALNGLGNFEHIYECKKIIKEIIQQFL